MLTNKVKFIYLFFSCIFFSVSFLFADWIIKINDKEISETKFKSYARLFLKSIRTYNEPLKTDEIVLNDLLEEFIKAQLLLNQAEKKGYYKKSKQSEKLFQEFYLKWIEEQFIFSKVKDESALNVTEKQMKEYYNEVASKQPQLANQPYNSISLEVKSQLQQQVLLNNLLEFQKNYYKIMKNGVIKLKEIN